jgi:hypothetical protein
MGCSLDQEAIDIGEDTLEGWRAEGIKSERHGILLMAKAVRLTGSGDRSDPSGAGYLGKLSSACRNLARQ